MRFTELTELFLQSRTAEGFRPNTLRNYRKDFQKVVHYLGDIDPVKGKWVNGCTEGGISPIHMDRLFAAMIEEGTYSAGTINITQSSLQALFRWARQRGYLYPDQDPMGGRKTLKSPPRARNRLSLAQFQELLDLDIHPRDRMLISLGMFLLLRQSEAQSLRIGDVDMEANTITVTVHKSRITDVMKIPLEMRSILRDWLTYYTQEKGKLDPHWYLVPAKHNAPWGQTSYLKPTQPVGRVAEQINRALDLIGFPTRDADGKSLREGMHTLRRSGALNLYYELVNHGAVDEALRVVQNVLHHASIRTTEHYLGLESAREARNRLFDENLMYPSLTARNVVPLRGVNGKAV